MKIEYKISKNQIKIFLLIFNFYCFILIRLWTDSLRYVFAGKQFIENFVIIYSEPIINLELYENKYFIKIKITHIQKEFLQFYIYNFLYFFFTLKTV